MRGENSKDVYINNIGLAMWDIKIMFAVIGQSVL